MPLPSSALQMILGALIFAGKVHRTAGFEIEDDRESYGGAALRGRLETVNGFPQIYNVYLEPANKGDLESEKRSRLFVGKRFSDSRLEDEDDYIQLSSENDGPFLGAEIKRNHLFVGKRRSPKFVGKRSVAGQMRVKRFALGQAKTPMYGSPVDKDGVSERENEDRMWKVWMSEEEEGSGSEKRSRMFVGKRRGLDLAEAEDNKRSRLFVGRRSGLAWEDQNSESDAAFPAEEETGKRARLFVGKRPSFKRPIIVDAVDNIHVPLTEGSEASDPDPKRARLFPGKRPAPGFVGKRETQK